MGQQQQQQPVQDLRPGIDPAKMMATPAVPLHRKSFSVAGDVVSRPTAVVRKASSSPLMPLNFWRKLTPEDFVIGYARGLGRVRCSACLSKITQGQLQLGAFYMHEDKFTLLRWHHQRCVDAPDCLKSPLDLCGIEDLAVQDVDEVCRWLGSGGSEMVKDRSWTA